MKFAFIRDYLSSFEVEAACRVLQVSRSGLYAWLKRSPSARQCRRDGMAVRIRAVHADNRRVHLLKVVILPEHATGDDYAGD